MIKATNFTNLNLNEYDFSIDCFSYKYIRFQEKEYTILITFLPY